MYLVHPHLCVLAFRRVHVESLKQLKMMGHGLCHLICPARMAGPMLDIAIDTATFLHEACNYYRRARCSRYGGEFQTDGLDMAMATGVPTMYGRAIV